MQCGQVAARQMVAQKQSGNFHGGAIINMSSVNAVMAIPTICAYNASKGGINNLTRCLLFPLSFSSVFTPLSLSLLSP